ncbi:hypothetical protein SBOR_6065 [Sclerotinia borealis F-4128]|uniref:Zn(2)-C6 fungal-type domain-containing protein n=1 Tax=Sclerotinia borealis (strain F-4128) TaxID=1432307 RepID=W9CCK4_SCLBF|nr:hypothetical protein SBOR_6065 [Sclerotinia borealis F-4128]
MPLHGFFPEILALARPRSSVMTNTKANTKDAKGFRNRYMKQQTTERSRENGRPSATEELECFLKSEGLEVIFVDDVRDKLFNKSSIDRLYDLLIALKFDLIWNISMMPLRRSHIKSHHGCSQCKFRRVKCDELQPICSRCTTYKRECKYNSVITQAPGQYSFELRPPPISKFPKHKPKFIRPSSRPSRPHPPQSQNPNYGIQAPLPFGLHKEADALLHHYVNVTCKPMTSAFNRPDQTKWEGAVRRNASTHEFVYNGMLSFAALHLAVLQPQNRSIHITKALKFQNSGMTEFRPVLENITASNCEAALGFSGLLISSIYAFPVAQAGPDRSSERLLDYLPVIFSLFNGTVAIYRMGWMKSLDSNLSVQLRNKVMAADATNTPAAGEEFLEQLERREIAILKDARLRDLYTDVSSQVRRNLRRTQQFPGKVWPGAAPPPYIQCVKQRDPIALVLVAYWAVGQDRGVGYNWWAKNWARDLVEMIGVELGVSSKWWWYMRWPRERMGLVQ